MAKLQYEQPVTINGKEHSLPENRAVEDWTWNRVKLYSFIFACLAAVSGFLLLGYWLGGGFGCYTCTQNQPTPVAVVASPPTSRQAETATIAELDKTRWAILGMMAKQAAMAEASASVATTVVVPPPPPPKAERRARVTKQAESVCPCPLSPDKTQTLEQGSAPTPTLSSTERRRNDMWSALRQ